jgi:hypothetical protein
MIKTPDILGDITGRGKHHSSRQFQYLPPLKTAAFISLLKKIRLASGKRVDMA